MDDLSDKISELYVIGNNYDGLLLTGDVTDCESFKKVELSKFYSSITKVRKIRLGIRNGCLIDSIYSYYYIQGKSFHLG